MITKAHRFHGFNALRHVYSRGQTVRGSFMAVKYLANPRRDSYRAAVVVSRKVHKSAVVRNRIRRRVYEIIRHMEPLMNGPYDIVITIYSERVADIPADALRSSLVDQLQRAHVLSVPPKESHAIVERKDVAVERRTADTEELAE